MQSVRKQFVLSCHTSFLFPTLVLGRLLVGVGGGLWGGAIGAIRVLRRRAETLIQRRSPWQGRLDFGWPACHRRRTIGADRTGEFLLWRLLIARLTVTGRARCLLGRPDQFHLLGWSFGPTQHHTIPFAVDAKGLAVELSGQIERLFGHALPGQLQGVGRHTLSERFEHFRRGTEETIRRDQAVHASMRTLEVIVVDEQADPLPGIAQIHKHGRLDAFPP